MELEPEQGFYFQGICCWIVTVVFQYHPRLQCFLQRYRQAEVESRFHYKSKDRKKEKKEQKKYTLEEEEENPEEMALGSMFANVKNCSNKEEWVPAQTYRQDCGEEKNIQEDDEDTEKSS